MRSLSSRVQMQNRHTLILGASYKICQLFCFSNVKCPNEGTIFKLRLDEYFTDTFFFFFKILNIFLAVTKYIFLYFLFYTVQANFSQTSESTAISKRRAKLLSQVFSFPILTQMISCLFPDVKRCYLAKNCFQELKFVFTFTICLLLSSSIQFDIHKWWTRSSRRLSQKLFSLDNYLFIFF